jgi:hypothetical protein
MLLENYTNEVLVNSLIDIGDMSSLAKTPKQCKSYQDRGEPWEDIQPLTHSSVKEFLPSGEEFNYVFVPGVNQWFVDRTHPNETECHCGMSRVTKELISKMKYS